MKKICCIISAGDVNYPLLKEKKTEYDYFIAADQGYEKAKACNIQIDLLVGDFDSISQTEFSNCYHGQNQEPKPSYSTSMQIKRFPIEKDYSDTHLAIEEGIALGYTCFHIYGALGGDRLSHTIANLQTMYGMQSKGIEIILMGTKEIVYMISNSSFILSLPKKTSFSLFALNNKATGVSIQGAKYTLENQTLTNDFPLGVSNESLESNIVVSVENGCLLLIVEQY